MKDLAYSPLKATRHLDIIQATRHGRPARPAHVQIILSDLCNQSCNFCAYRDPGYTSSQLFYEIKPAGAGLRRDAEHKERNYNPNRMIETSKAMEIIRDCADIGVSGVQFTGGGEPTVHPDFAKIVSYAQERGLATALVTNGVNVGKRFEAWRENLLGLSWIRFSIDAGTKKTYTRIRNVPDQHFNFALLGMNQLKQARKDVGHGPVIGAGFVVTPENWNEIYEGVELVKRFGADNVRISAQFSADDEARFSGFHQDAARAAARAATDFTDDKFTVVNRFSEKMDDLRQKAPDYDGCGYQIMTTYIGADLNVYRCCSTSYNNHGLVGSIKEQSFRNLWMDQKRFDEMMRFNAKSCDRCQFNIINRNLEYMMRDDEPNHSEFV